MQKKKKLMPILIYVFHFLLTAVPNTEIPEFIMNNAKATAVLKIPGFRLTFHPLGGGEKNLCFLVQ